MPGLISLGVLVERMTAGGEAFGVPAPRLRVGEEANLCLLDLDAEWTVGEAGYESRSANCAFDGWRLTGRVRMTVAARRGGLPRALVRHRPGGVMPAREAYLLLEDGTRFDGEAAGGARRRTRAPPPPARSCSTPRCRATRRRSPTRATAAR